MPFYIPLPHHPSPYHKHLYFFADFPTIALSPSSLYSIFTIISLTLSKTAIHFVLVVYSNALASLILLPFWDFFICKKKQPPITSSFLCKIFCLSVAGFNLMQNCVIIGVRYSFPTLASALANLISAFTFLLAVIFSIRHNQLSLSLLLCQYFSRIQSHLHPSHSTMLTISNNWLISGLFIATVCLSLSVKIVGQAAVLKGYPSEITLVSFYCLFGDPNAWMLSLDIELISIVYSVGKLQLPMFALSFWQIEAL
ncbi:hypothetical protein GOBAR_AA21839 [Gossypium barbadense]|uniref:WAT1-related protein n=1 Tax=Gossypium barbadense TaxID=3634 RepID=A0A2P5X684_GOSBA|nr:hypothetical protein GOBAR_AA21839 [Gossypium barbadense]